MNKHTLIAAALTAFVFAASPVLAGNDHGHGKAKHGKAHKSAHKSVHTDHDRYDHDRYVRVDHDRYVSGRHDNGRHLGWYKQQWKRGDRIVWTDIERRYYVEDYRTYRLSAPPQGYRWVRPMDDRYLLVQVATGLITKVLGY